MAKRIKITAGGVTVYATLNDTATAKLVAAALPIKASANTWGEEIYFGIPVQTGLANGKEVVEMGDIGYWPPGSAFCLFFGRTPASRGDEIRPASAVNIIGKIDGDATVLKQARSGAAITIEAAD